MSRHQESEGLVVFPADHSFLGDEDLVEEGLVDQFPDDRVGFEVCLVAVLCPGDCLGDRQFDLFDGELGGSQPTLRGLDLASDPFLLTLEQVKWYGSGHPVQALEAVLHLALRVGARPAGLVALGIRLTGGGEADGYQRAIAFSQEIHTAVDDLGSGAFGRAGRALCGLTVESRGRPLKDRRRLAAQEMDLAVSTWRKYYERSLVEDLAMAIWLPGKFTAEN